MGLLARAFRLSGQTLGRPPCSFLLSLGDVVPLVPILINSINPYDKILEGLSNS
jgi:hypothetical protein